MHRNGHQHSRRQEREYYDRHHDEYNLFYRPLPAVVNLENKYKKLSYAKGLSKKLRPFQRQLRLCSWEYEVPRYTRLPSPQQDHMLMQTCALLVRKTGVLHAVAEKLKRKPITLKVVGLEETVVEARMYIRKIEQKKTHQPALAYLAALPDASTPSDLKCGVFPRSPGPDSVTDRKSEVPLGSKAFRDGCGKTEDERILNCKKLTVLAGCAYRGLAHLDSETRIQVICTPEAEVRMKSIARAMDMHPGLTAERILATVHGFEEPESAAITIPDTPSGAVEHPEPHQRGSKRGPGEELEGGQVGMAAWSTSGKRIKQQDVNRES